MSNQHKTRKTWFITGCDSGMGHAVAQYVLEQGDVVVITARDPANVQSLRQAHPQMAHVWQLDVTDHAQIAQVTQAALETTGGIDVLFNNAGYGVMGAMEETSAKEYRPMFEVNFFGLVEVTKHLLPHMRERGSGYIFNTSSLGGYAASAGFAFYAASKFAVEGFTDALAQEVGPFGVHAMILEPGSFRTQFSGASLRIPAQRIAVYDATPIRATQQRIHGRNGKQPNDPQKLAKVLFECSRMDKLPLRLQLGEDALQRVRTKVASVQAECDAWEATALSVAFPAGT